jgi:hypothetical protein
MKPTIAPPARTTAALALATFASGVVAAPTAAGAARTGCIAPDVVGVSFASARGALTSSGCEVQVRQLPGHGLLVAPASPDGRQIVASQSPRAGGRTSGVTVWLKPLCAQPTWPGPAERGPTTSSGPAELVAGLFLFGGPLVTAPQCRLGTPSAAVLTVTSASGKLVAKRSVRAGHFGVFALKPGEYELGGTSSGAPGGRQARPERLTILARHTTRLNLLAAPR